MVDDHLAATSPTSPTSFFGLGGERRFRLEVARVTAGADATGRWLDELKPLLRQLLDYDAAWLGRYDAVTGRYIPLLADGHAEPLHRLFASDLAASDARQLGFRQPGWPRLAHTITAELAGLRGWSTYLAPAGFRDGLGVGLRTERGRHVGFLTLLTYRPDVARAVAAALLHAVTPLLADAVERLYPPVDAADR